MNRPLPTPWLSLEPTGGPFADSDREGVHGGKPAAALTYWVSEIYPIFTWDMERLQAVRTSSDTPRRLCERLKVATEKNIESKGVAKGLRTAHSVAAF